MKIQSNLPLVVLTFPGHFLLTALTIQSYLKHHTPSSVIVIVDDLSQKCWPGYVQDCKRLYNTTVIPTSLLPAVVNVGSGWLRQQLIKLYLDHLLPFDSWFFTDGDVEYRCPVPANITPFTLTSGGPIQEKQNFYVTSLLGIDNPGIFVNCATITDLSDNLSDVDKFQVCVSNPPFRFMSSFILQKLRDHIKNQHSESLIDIHSKLYSPTNSESHIGVSEWELLATFEQLILGKDLNLTFYPSSSIIQNDTGIKNINDLDYCGTCYCTDSGFERDWWDSKEIKVTDDLWDTISKIKK